MIVSINQPAYLPWLGYFHRIAISDLHIVLDHVQFEKNSFTNRNKVRTSQGSTWLTVPVRTSGRFGELRIDDLEISNDRRWSQKHWDTLRLNYAHAPHFATYQAFFARLYEKRWEHLMPLMCEINRCLLAEFGIRTTIIASSEMGATGYKDELVLNLCRAVGATTYLSGPLGKNYLREHLFAEAGIRVTYHDYRHPTYRQAHPGFESHMAAVDLLFNCGGESASIMTRDQVEIPA
jgi:hypothetical protein